MKKEKNEKFQEAFQRFCMDLISKGGEYQEIKILTNREFIDLHITEKIRITEDFLKKNGYL